MSWRQVLFDTIYRIGRPIWDIPTPPEIIDVVEGAHALPPGRALDLGCGTSPNVAYLAQHGWEATGSISLRKRSSWPKGTPAAFQAPRSSRLMSPSYPLPVSPDPSTSSSTTAAITHCRRKVGPTTCPNWQPS